jgi:hypothetical protein
MAAVKQSEGVKGHGEPRWAQSGGAHTGGGGQLDAVVVGLLVSKSEVCHELELLI